MDPITATTVGAFAAPIVAKYVAELGDKAFEMGAEAALKAPVKLAKAIIQRFRGRTELDKVSQNPTDAQTISDFGAVIDAELASDEHFATYAEALAKDAGYVVVNSTTKTVNQNPDISNTIGPVSVTYGQVSQ